MNTTSDSTNPGHPFVAGFWLMIAIPIFAFIVLPILMRLGVDDLYTLPGLIVMFAVHFASGFMWARSLGMRSGMPGNRTMNIFGGLGFALGVVGTLILYTSGSTVADAINRWVESFEGVGNLEFGALFAPWTGLACGVSGFALGIGLKGWKLALKLLVLGFITGLGLYLAIMFTMELLGFKVGSGRPVMLPTTFLSMWSAALVGSALFGKMLTKSKTS
ncbi:MAG TPA: hypothetical protein VFQ23_07880 [Anaerolineales bacterium]|nr:hypothetical protein [Anaerolineales bacterium]